MRFSHVIIRQLRFNKGLNVIINIIISISLFTEFFRYAFTRTNNRIIWG
jgi:hypothetical protein